MTRRRYTPGEYLSINWDSFGPAPMHCVVGHVTLAEFAGALAGEAGMAVPLGAELRHVYMHVVRGPDDEYAGDRRYEWKRCKYNAHGAIAVTIWEVP